MALKAGRNQDKTPRERLAERLAISGPIGKLAKEYCDLVLPVTVLKSRAGYYLGTSNEEDGPVSRESAEYWDERGEAEEALRTGEWTQREVP